MIVTVSLGAVDLQRDSFGMPLAVAIEVAAIPSAPPDPAFVGDGKLHLSQDHNDRLSDLNHAFDHETCSRRE
jgi:hypothetical protein